MSPQVPIEHKCPHCGTHLLLEQVHAGREVPCPRCFETFDAPAELVPPPRAPGALRLGPGKNYLLLSIAGLVGAVVGSGCACALPAGILAPVSLFLVWRERRRDIEAGRLPRPELQTPLVISAIGTGIFLLMGAYTILMTAGMAAQGVFNF